MKPEPTISVCLQCARDALGHYIGADVEILQFGVAAVGTHHQGILFHQVLCRELIGYLSLATVFFS